MTRFFQERPQLLDFSLFMLFLAGVCLLLLEVFAWQARPLLIALFAVLMVGPMIVQEVLNMRAWRAHPEDPPYGTL